MNIIKIFSILFIISLFISCKDENIVMSAVKDGKELEQGTGIPFRLEQNYPNPFNPSTHIRFGVARDMHIKLSVYSEDWEFIKALVDSNLTDGYYSVYFDAVNNSGEGLPSGNYYYTLEGDGYKLTRVMKLLK